MKRIELTKDGKHSYLSTCGGLLAEFVGTNAQGLELVAKFNQHADLVKTLRGLATLVPGPGKGGIEHLTNAQALLDQIDKDYPQ